MFLPVKTQGYDGRPRPGLAGILMVCLLMQLWAWHDKSKRAAAVALLKYGDAPSCTPGKVSLKVLQTAEEFGVLKTAGMQIQRSDIAVNRLEQMRKASVVYRAGLVADHPNPANFLTALFTHASWSHLVFTFWFLYLAGSTLEKYWGTALFLGVFIACGIIGEFAFLIAFGHAEPAAGFALVGPSGALAGLMGAFAITHRNSQVTLLDFVFGASRGLREFPIQRILAAWAILELLTSLFLPGRGGRFTLIATLSGGLTGLTLGALLPGNLPQPAPKPLPNWTP